MAYTGVVRKLSKWKMISKLKKRKRNKKQQRTKRQIKAVKKEQYFRKWGVVGGLVKFRPPRKPRHKNEWVFERGVLAWPTLQDYIDSQNPKYSEGIWFYIEDFEEKHAMVLDIHNSKKTNHVLVKILLPERECWVRRQDLRKPKEIRI